MRLPFSKEITWRCCGVSVTRQTHSIWMTLETSPAHTQQRAEVRELGWAQREVMGNRRRKTREPCNLGRRLKRLRKYSFLN